MTPLGQSHGSDPAIRRLIFVALDHEKREGELNGVCTSCSHPLSPLNVYRVWLPKSFLSCNCLRFQLESTHRGILTIPHPLHT